EIADLRLIDVELQPAVAVVETECRAGSAPYRIRVDLHRYAVLGSLRDAVELLAAELDGERGLPGPHLDADVPALWLCRQTAHGRAVVGRSIEQLPALGEAYGARFRLAG